MTSIVRGGGGHPPPVNPSFEVWKLAGRVRQASMKGFELLLDGINRGTQHQAKALLAELEALQPQLPPLERALSAGLRKATSEEIADQLGILVLAFPMSGAGDISGFGRLLRLDVEAEQPSVWALEAAGRRLRQTCQFLPKIAEVLTTLRDEEDALVRSLAAVKDIPLKVDRIASALAEIKPPLRAV